MNTCHCLSRKSTEKSTHSKPVHVAFCGFNALVEVLMMDRSLHTVLLISATFCVFVQEGFGLPVFQPSETQSSLARVRTKRCSCSNWLDKECIYFCHLDIIWVNTPSKITPYGLGSPLSRRRRSTGRCECANPNDPTCSSFCHTSSMDPGLVVVSPLDPEVGHVYKADKDLLTYFRQVAKANLIAAKHSAVSRKKLLKTNNQSEKDAK